MILSGIPMFQQIEKICEIVERFLKKPFWIFPRMFLKLDTIENFLHSMKIHDIKNNYMHVRKPLKKPAHPAGALEYSDCIPAER